MIALITNKAAGVQPAESRLSDVRAAFGTMAPDIEFIEADGPEITSVARDAMARGARMVVAAGGDGTINAVATALVGSTTPLAVLPMGTLNHFASDAGIPTAMHDAVALIDGGTVKTIDVGVVNNRIFLNNSSIGAYPLMLRERDMQRSRFKQSKWWAMIKASVAIFKRFPAFGVDIKLNGETVHYETPAVVVGNNVYTLDMRMLGTRERMDAGVLSVYVIRARTRWEVLKLIVSTIFSKLEEDDLFQIMEAESAVIDVGRAMVDVSIDGEVVRMSSPLEYRVRKKALRVVAGGIRN
jgi:diacylglycerol kinase family enzyme